MIRLSKLRQLGDEPRSIALKATMLAATPLMLVIKLMSCRQDIWFFSVWRFDDEAFKTASAGS